MICNKCGSDNVIVSSELASSKLSYRKVGCLTTLVRWSLICCTLGLWLLTGKRKGYGKTKYKNNTIAICQNCGFKFKVK